MLDKPVFSIVIPALNEERNLPVLLASLENQTFREFEVIIVDSGSTDNTKYEATKFLQKNSHFKFIEHRCKNVSQARNFGAQQARSDWLIFFDADGEVEKIFLDGIKKRITENKLDMLTVWNRGKTKNLTGIITLFLLNSGMTLLQKIKPAANGPCIIIKKSLFEKIGCFDETIVFGEDFDLTRKAHKEKARFAVFSTPKFYVSTRRFEKEGFFLSIYKAVKALLYQMFFGPIRKPLFDYEMGGQYYKDKQQNANS